MTFILSFLKNEWYSSKIVVTILMVIALQSYAVEPAKVNFRCNIHTINKVEGQTNCAQLDDKFGGYCLIFKSKHQNEQVGHMGLLLLRDSSDCNRCTLREMQFRMAKHPHGGCRPNKSRRKALVDRIQDRVER